MSFEDIKLDIVDGVATLLLDRPDSVNALRHGTLAELIEALDHVRHSSARALLITGAGRAFCSGADLSPADGGAARHADTPRDGGMVLERYYNPIVERLAAFPMPVVVAVNGIAAGAGCSLALAADFVLAASSAQFLLAFAKIGLVPDVGLTWILPRLVGPARALRMMMLGERITARQAAEWGMIYDIVDDEHLMAEATALAARLAAGPTLAYALIRRGTRDALQSSLSETLRAEYEAQRQAAASEDYREGVAAFGAKRPPHFTGR